MEAPLSSHYINSRDQPSRSSYTRNSSRSSNGAPSLRMAQQERPSSSLNPNGPRASPVPSCSTENSARFRSSINDAASMELRSSDSRPSLTATSSYLQEKLNREKERKVESERSSSRLSNDKMMSSSDLRTSQISHTQTPTQSPARPLFDISRPKSSAGHLDSSSNASSKSKKAGVGLKEMETTLTNLHKENFDLKLEVFHRREKQTALEERCQSLEAEKIELESDKRNLEGEKHDLEEINDKLMSELEMRDKAVEEAVAMIVSLEARMEELLHEREVMMEQQAEKEQQFFATDARLRQALNTAFDQVNNQPRSKPSISNVQTQPQSAQNAQNTPKLKSHPSTMRIVDDFTHTINRMPSFVSDRSELTENLRNVYLGTRAGSSIASLSHDHFQYQSMDGAESDLRDARIGSPALSVLSESSFLSIYGKKELPPMNVNISSAPTRGNDRRRSQIACVPDIPRSMPDSAPSVDISMKSVDSNGSGETCVEGGQDNVDNSNGSAANVVAHALASTNNYHHNQSTTPRKRSTANDFIGTNSPLQRIEQLDKSKQDKKDALRRVRTDVPFATNQNSHNLPPTPDTISTSTLRRYKNSSETLANSRSTSGDQRMSAVESFVDSIPNKPRVPSTIAFGRYNETSKGQHSTYFDDQLNIPQRPRSAGETTVSHHGRGSVWDSESSDGEDMDLDGNDSASLQDYWLRESLRPTGQAPPPHPHRHRSRSRRTGSGTFSNGRISPDLFSFPTTSNGWATTAMFGALHGHGYNGPNSYGSNHRHSNSYTYRSAPLAQTLDALGDSLPAPAAGLFGPTGLLASPLPYGMSMSNGSTTGPPPPPHRRSSLHARTGSSRSGSRHGTAPGTPSITPSFAPGIMSSASKNHNSRRSPTRPQTRAGTMTTTSSDERPGTTMAAAAPAAPAPADLANAKQRHYPPASNGNATSRSRVLSLFRRSGSHEVAQAAQAQAAVSQTQAAEPPADTNTNDMGMPSRVRGDDELAGNNSLGLALNDVGASATPPPIMRNPRNPRGSVDAGPAQAAPDANAAEVKDVDVPAPAAEPQEAAAATPAAPGQRMKWLGRVTSLRTRTG